MRPAEAGLLGQGQRSATRGPIPTPALVRTPQPPPPDSRPNTDRQSASRNPDPDPHMGPDPRTCTLARTPTPQMGPDPRTCTLARTPARTRSAHGDPAQTAVPIPARRSPP